MPAHVPIQAAAFARRPLAYAKTHAPTQTHIPKKIILQM